MLTIDSYIAIDISSRIVAIGLIMSTLEMITIRHQFGTNGVFSIGTVSPFYRTSGILPFVDKGLPLIVSLQVFSAGGLLLAGPFSMFGKMMLLLSTITSILIRWRRNLGGDGAEQVNMLFLIAASLALVPYSSAGNLQLLIWFITAQLCLSYLTAGIAKLISPLWRSGKAIPAILSTYAHGHAGAASFLHKHPVIALLLSWGVMLSECSFPFLIMGPDWLLLSALAAGFFFHASCAFLMGLNSFLLSFPAMYPCVLAAFRSPLIISPL